MTNSGYRTRDIQVSALDHAARDGYATRESRADGALDHRLLLRPAALAMSVAVLILLALLLAPSGFDSGPVATAAQQVYRVGFLSQGQPPKAYLEALQADLREQGYVQGRNLVWESRWPAPVPRQNLAVGASA
jgi:hypothetical protein